MTFKYNKVYLNNTYTVVGPYEDKGPLSKYFDDSYKDLYCDADTWEKAEVKLLEESMKKVLRKNKMTKEDVDLVIAGDLLNQVCASSYASEKIEKPFLGVYSACASNIEGMIIGSNFIEKDMIKTCLCGTSSHNMSSEKQYRNPTEYGAPKPETATFTATGGASAIISNEKSDIRIESGTIGKIIDYNQKDALNMGAVMAGAAADTIKTHLEDLNRDASYYDLIVTGDLGIIGKEILKEYLMKEYKINISKNYNDCGVMLYDLKKQKEVLAGGSGPVCSALVTYGFILNQMREKKLKRVLIVATGALFSPTFLYQKQNILSIAHAISLEAI
ncbi:MAG: stage V sporulation protein AD [Bacilli bacterium]|nr:stage V sporulation protein AD [Bacilli bacterium]